MSLGTLIFSSCSLALGFISRSLSRLQQSRFPAEEEAMAMAMAMASLPKYQLLLAFHFLVFLQSQVLCFQYKVGDLDSWGIPISSNKQIYNGWSKKHHFQIGDSIMFLYPPSQDSVIQVTEEAFKICNISNPILYMDDGNSVFNITSSGNFYFTSGAPGHCQKSQKLVISVLSGNESSFAPSYAPSVLPASSPSYQNVFGSIPSTSSSPRSIFPSFMTAAVAAAVVTFFQCL